MNEVVVAGLDQSQEAQELVEAVQPIEGREVLKWMLMRCEGPVEGREA